MLRYKIVKVHAIFYTQYKCTCPLRMAKNLEGFSPPKTKVWKWGLEGKAVNCFVRVFHDHRGRGACWNTKLNETQISPYQTLRDYPQSLIQKMVCCCSCWCCCCCWWWLVCCTFCWQITLRLLYILLTHPSFAVLFVDTPFVCCTFRWHTLRLLSILLLFFFNLQTINCWNIFFSLQGVLVIYLLYFLCLTFYFCY